MNKDYETKQNEFLLLAEEQSSAFVDDLEIQDSAGESKASLKFHISSDDYFGTLASIMNLLTEKNMVYNSRHKQALKRIADDLVFLQQNYKIVRK